LTTLYFPAKFRLSMARRIAIFFMVWLGLLVPQVPVGAASCDSPVAVRCSCCAPGCACDGTPAERPQPPDRVPPAKSEFIFLSLPPATHTVRLRAAGAANGTRRFPDSILPGAPVRPASIRFCSFLL
jgi:hypothetical protein